jgi:large subunit ribosomal protein L22
MEKDLQKKIVKAAARYVRYSPRKLRLIADLTRGKQVDEALQQLQFSSKNAALPMFKLINSAIANAVHNFDLQKEQLFIKTLTVDMGPTLKRFTPRAQGRAAMLKKKSSHISIELEARKQSAKSKRSIFARKSKVQAEGVEGESQTTLQQEGKVNTEKPSGPKNSPKSSEKIKQNVVSLKRRLFNRKTNA